MDGEGELEMYNMISPSPPLSSIPELNNNSKPKHKHNLV
jgi:hypothetical protein